MVLWTIGSLLLVAFNVLAWLVTIPTRRWPRRLMLAFLVMLLLVTWLVPAGGKRSDTAAVQVSLDHTYGLVSWEFENFFDKWRHRV